MNSRLLAISIASSAEWWSPRAWKKNRSIWSTWRASQRWSNILSMSAGLRGVSLVTRKMFLRTSGMAWSHLAIPGSEPYALAVS